MPDLPAAVLRVLGVAQAQGVGQPAARRDDGDALLQQRIETRGSDDDAREGRSVMIGRLHTLNDTGRCDVSVE